MKPTSLFADGIAWALVLLLLADKHFIVKSDLVTKPLLATSLTNLLTEQPTMMVEFPSSCPYKPVCVWPRAPNTHLADDCLGDAAANSTAFLIFLGTTLSESTLSNQLPLQASLAQRTQHSLRAH